MTTTAKKTHWRTSDVSERTGIPEPTLVTWRCLGKGPDYFKIGRSVYYDPADVETWLEKQRVSPSQAVES